MSKLSSKIKKYINFIPVKVYQNSILGWGTSMVCYFLSIIDDIISLISLGFIKSTFSYYYMSYIITRNFKRRN